MNRHVIGIDVGGTNIKLGVVTRAGRIVARSYLSTKEFSHKRTRLIEAMIAAVQELMRSCGVTARECSGIGMGLPGLIDFKKGSVIFLPNVPGWKNVPLSSVFRRALRIPTFVDNDVNVITLGEWHYGAGVGAENMVCMTMGTGVGGGLIFNNRLYRGEGFVAGEIGHMPLNEAGPECNCGGYGCFERYVGNQPLLERAQDVFGKKDVSLEEISRLAVHEDPKARKFWEEAGGHIGNALTGVVNLLNPTRVVVGGGVANFPVFVFDVIRATIKRRAMRVQSSMVRVVKAKLGNDAGLLGARVLVQESLR